MDIRWIMDVINKLSEIGRTDKGGSNRLGFTGADIEARRYMIGLIEESGLKIRTDGFGNIFARLEGADSSKPVVATGSHIDTVPNGGHYDGILGTVSSLAAIKRIKEEGFVHSFPIELIIFQLEESSRFGHATMGSKVISGKNVCSMWKNAVDKDGISLSDALAANGLDFMTLPSSKRRPEEFKAFVELHIDQSTALEKSGDPVGVVEAIAAPIRSKIRITGEAAHSGSTKMTDRKDALVSAAEFILAVRNLGLAYSEKKIVATVGNVKVTPGAMNVIPGSAELFIDLRGIYKNVMDEVFDLIRSEAQKVGLRYGTPFEIELLSEETPVSMDKSIYSTIKKSCKDLGINPFNVISGAGHDAMNMAELAPSGMIFVRSRSGISHHPDEYASPEDIKVGFDLLTETIKRLSA